MAKKLTKKERIDTKVKAGTDHITAEMEVIKEDNDEALRKLEIKREREQKRIDEATVGIIREHYPDVWTEAQTLAREQIEERRTKRAAAASKPRDGAHAAEPEAPAEQNTSQDQQQTAPGGEHSGAHFGH